MLESGTEGVRLTAAMPGRAGTGDRRAAIAQRGRPAKTPAGCLTGLLLPSWSTHRDPLDALPLTERGEIPQREEEVPGRVAARG